MNENWKKLTTEELVGRYRENSANHGRLLDARKTRAANKEYDRATAIEAELRLRGAEANERILKLLDDPEPGTRFWAASAALRFAPEEAARVLAELAKPPMSMVGLSATMTLEDWQGGTYKPE
ncbi:DUF2019 domain-containing protein [Pyxidicoccus fallax]|uniref:DUF2019 domain-containing protein n=1 Tax=Pyxidicoccus fallax TaxID=394095 RepID=A0A848LB26_9BACT|nr:DUF2019 domain-containing protein [Pyxidicoccus fallax]NMO13893.1 DUF2019 domain-containing protein [Pyxidicoccus fallax]NPC81272.1 DUF2019 domain-containing protein [Pyxidicoccus fallax]